MAYVCHWPLTVEARVQFRPGNVEFVADSATGIGCPPTTVRAKLKIIHNFLLKTNSFLIYTYRIRRVTGTVTDIAHYKHPHTKSKDPASHDYNVVTTTLIRIATMSAVLMTYK
jgi:hypothetical protein